MAEEITTQAPQPAATDGLTPAEQRFFESGGTDIPGARDPAPEPPPAPAAAEAPAAPEPPAPEPAKHFVEKGALDSERNRRKKAEQALEQLNQRFAALEARLPPPPQPQAPPAVEEDPISEIKRLRSIVDTQTAQQQEQAQIVQVLNQSDAMEREYAAEQPDYHGALDYLRNQLLEEAKIAGVPHPVAMAQIQRQAAITAYQAMQQGRNPGEIFYAYARARGWKAPEAAPAPAPVAAQPAPAAPARSAAHEALAMLDRGQQASQSLSAAPGRATDGTSLAEIAELDGPDFLKAWGRAEKIMRAGRA